MLISADNTNADPQTRAVWIALAREMDVPIRCVYFTAPSSLCEHNDTVRALAGACFNPEKRSILPHSAFSSFASRFKEPQAGEGFQDIIKIDFQVLPPAAFYSRSTSNERNILVLGKRRAASHLESILDLVMHARMWTNCQHGRSSFPLGLRK